MTQHENPRQNQGGTNRVPTGGGDMTEPARPTAPRPEPPLLIEALGEAMNAYGVRWMVGDQVALARDLAGQKVTRQAVATAMGGRGLKAPAGFAAEVARLVRRWS